MTRKVLIASRGEIAIRIARAARELGWEPITIYEDGDKYSPHIRAGVLAIPVKSYTDMNSIIDAAIKADADVIHPGYGFLSENPDFAEKVLGYGIGWAGPSPKAMRLLGDKNSAKELARKLDVPTLPWCEAHSPEEARRCADRIGYPVILKASLAGGGRGSRIAYTPEEVEQGFKLVKMEADLGFGNAGTIFVEKFINHARHIEVQILGDGSGNVIHLFERECSLQRRRQKIVEEAPSPFVERIKHRRPLREELTKYAVALGEAVNYSSAGTIEFIVDPQGNPYFIEANTRLQVEHGVTEEVTGIDIVKQQLLVAAGYPLSITQDGVKLHGWAIEARVYAEDPFNNFSASEGIVTRLKEPRGPGIRVDSGIEEGMQINPKYDTLLVKIIARGFSRSEALSKLRWALRETVIGGIETNLDLLRAITDRPWFADAEYDTQTIEKSLNNLLSSIASRRKIVKAIAEKIVKKQGATLQLLRNSISNAVTRYNGYGWPWPPWRIARY
ncbi:acetyl-CoA carboxylase biotin carboxylase subunit [Pyrofollis japonicus]|uniref:acetyl-CoA carboxylase biotin carboxylase subunit n=1 Tax=Pyrofollis japonicus TaxID=3060460 RepID=UPI00295ACC7C|nr:biotin carboxylase N-terminal domain-containing protein [Pyrofollis japonicus]BEP17136.1 acetyl-CoA carboxylase biotin carboxylase subunit [Pyrofollis japonicus]